MSCTFSRIKPSCINCTPTTKLCFVIKNLRSSTGSPYVFTNWKASPDVSVAAWDLLGFCFFFPPQAVEEGKMSADNVSKAGCFMSEGFIYDKRIFRNVGAEWGWVLPLEVVIYTNTRSRKKCKFWSTQANIFQTDWVGKVMRPMLEPDWRNVMWQV